MDVHDKNRYIYIYICIFRYHTFLLSFKTRTLHAINHNSIFHSISLTKRPEISRFHVILSTVWPVFRWVVWCQLPPARWFLSRRKHACDRWSAPWRRRGCLRVSLDVFFELGGHIGMMYDDIDTVWFLLQFILWELVFIKARLMFFPDPRWGGSCCWGNGGQVNAEWLHKQFKASFSAMVWWVDVRHEW